MEALNKNTVNRYLMHKQHLSKDSRTDDILQIARDILGLHATSPTSPHLTLLARTNRFKRDDLNQELYENKTLAKIKCFRRTIFILPEDIVPIAFAATRSLSAIKPEQYEKYLGMTEKQYLTKTKQIADILHDRRLTTKEIKKELSSTESLTSIVNQMCDQGILVRGISKSSWKSNMHYYHLFNELYPNIDLDAYSELEAIKQLIQLYISAYGPVTLTDISWWSGLTKAAVRKQLEQLGDSIIQVSFSDLEGDYLMAKDDLDSLRSFKPSKEGTVAMLPLLDPYIMGYKDRSRYLDPDLYHKVFDRSGNGTYTIILNGSIIGVWDTPSDKEKLLKIHLFDTAISSSIHKQIVDMAESIGKFLSDSEVQVNFYESMVPLNERTAGGFMTPLRDSTS